MNKTLRTISIFVCLLVALSISGCYDAGYTRTDSDSATERLGELSDVFDEDIRTIELPDEEPSPIATESDDVEEVVSPEETTESDDTAFYDGKDESSEPTNTGTPSLTVTEGDLVKVGATGSDPDGDTVEYTFSKPLDANGEWQTARGDVGIYEAYVTATDGDKSLTKSIVIEVLKANDAPVINIDDEITVFEGDTVELDVTVTDADPADEPTYTINGWMQTTSKETGFEDAGEYIVTITATDGKDHVSKDVTIIVKNVNRAPEFEIVIG